MWEKLKSRKFWYTLFTGIGIVATMIAGEVPTMEGIYAIVALFWGYFIGNGMEHMAKAKKGGGK